MGESVYLDYNSTTPVKPEVMELVVKVMGEVGNPSSIHGFGRQARKHIEDARERTAALCGVMPTQVVFNSGATEANNTILKTFRGRRVITSAIEHSAVMNTLPDAERIPVMPSGIVDIDAFEKMLDEGEAPALISVMLVNNETGAIQPVEQIARMAKAKHRDVFIHTDAAQAAGRIKIDMPALQVDYLSLSSHKIGGPQGVGAVIYAPGAPLEKFMDGGGQEKRQRAGTENVAGIAGFGLACELAVRDMEKFQKLSEWRDEMEDRLCEIIPDLIVFSKDTARVSNTSAIGLPCSPTQNWLMGLDLAGVAIGSGSACSSGAIKTSHVLIALRPDDHDDIAALRISLGWGTEKSDIDKLVSAAAEIYQRMHEKTMQPA